MVSEQSSLYSNMSADMYHNNSNTNGIGNPQQHLMSPSRLINNPNMSSFLNSSDGSRSLSQSQGGNGGGTGTNGVGYTYKEGPRSNDYINTNNAVGETAAAAVRASASKTKRSSSAPPRIDRNRESIGMNIGSQVDDGGVNTNTNRASKWASTPLSNYMHDKTAQHAQTAGQRRHRAIRTNPITHSEEYRQDRHGEHNGHNGPNGHIPFEAQSLLNTIGWSSIW